MTEVKQDDEGRYCLNDFHKAAGGEDRHAPRTWTQNQQTIDLVNELLNGGIPPINSKAGRYGGTYVVKELVYAYAMWISPSLWLNNKPPREMVAELEGEAGITALVSLHGGNSPGTYVVKERVYAC